MWSSPILSGLPYHPFMAPPIGLTYSSYPFAPWHQMNPARPMDTERPMFWPQLQLSSNSDEPQETRKSFQMTPNLSLENGNSNQNILFFQPYSMGVGTAPLMFTPPSSISRTPVTLPHGRVGDLMQSVQIKPNRPSLGVLEAEVDKVNQAMLSREIDESHSRFTRRTKLPQLSDISPVDKFTPLRHVNSHFETNRKNSCLRRVHSPPVVGSCFAIPSPNAASTPLKHMEQKQTSESKAGQEIKDPVQESSTKLTAVIKSDQEPEIQPLDLRVRKRSAEDCDAEYQRNAKKSRVESYLNMQTPERNVTSTSQTNLDAKLFSYNETTSSVSGFSGGKHCMERDSLGSEDKLYNEKSAVKGNMTQRSLNPSNVSSVYSSPGYDSGVVVDGGYDSVISYEESILLIKSDVYVIYCCQQCEYRTLEKLEAQDHMAEHCYHVVKQRCTICEKDFSLNVDIISHVLQSHQPYDTRAFKCTQPNCNEAFSQEKLLNFHLRYVHGEKSYKCHQSGCGKSFSTGSALRHHQFVHTDMFKCTWEGCGKRFRDDYNLRTHFMIHTGKKPRQCSQCEYSCVQKNSMDWHMKTKHRC